MKLRKTMIALTTALTMAVSMSAVSYAQMLPMEMMISPAAPVSMIEHAYKLDLENAVVKHREQTAAFLAAEQIQKLDVNEMLFYPGDTLYIPIKEPATGVAYSAKTRPSNWTFETHGINDQAISNIRWSNENGALSIAVDFAQSLAQSEPVKVSTLITLKDTQNRRYEDEIYLDGSFSNLSRAILPNAVNEIVSPMNLHAGERYSGEAVTLSFGNNVFFKNAVMEKGKTAYLDLDRSFDSNIANTYRSFDIQCYNFLGDEDSFAGPGKVCLPAQKTDSYVYEVVNGRLSRIQSEFDEENGLVCFTSDTLGYYIVSPILMNE